MKNYFVSILIANYNNAEYLNRCIQSCINQSYKNLEILIYDDKSIDNSLTIIRKYRKKNIKFIKNNSKKTGLAAIDAKNSYYNLIKISKGHIIFLLDSDDYFEKNKVHEIVKVFHKLKKIDFIQNMPSIKLGNKLIKKTNKNNFLSYWPYFAPESCISFKKEFINKFIKRNSILEKKFEDVWLGFRLGVYAYFITNSFYSFNKHLTIYKSYGQSKKFKFFGYNWFFRRLNSFRYLKSISQNRVKLKFVIDYNITNFICKFLKIFK